MNIEAKRKYMLLCIVILLIAAIAAGTSDFWKDSGVENAKQGYVAVIRIDGPIYGGPDTDSILSGSSGVTSEQIMKEFQTARKDPQAKAILVRINSPGGSITAGMAIYDTMQYIKCDVSTICIGMAASMGAFLLSSGAKGKRIALPNSEIMIHQPLISGGLSGQCTDIKIASDHLVRVRKKMNEILAENTGKPLEVIERDTERDNYMYAPEAKEYGLIDKVIAHR